MFVGGILDYLFIDSHLNAIYVNNVSLILEKVS